MAAPGWREVLGAAAFTFVAGAAFPALARRLRGPSRPGPRGLMLYVAGNTLLGIGINAWLVPYLRRMLAEHERATEALRARLGRDPTHAEIAEHARAWRAGGRVS